MRDNDGRALIAELQEQICEIRKSMIVPIDEPIPVYGKCSGQLLGFRPPNTFGPCESFHAKDIKQRFEELYELLGVKRAMPENKIKLVKKTK